MVGGWYFTPVGVDAPSPTRERGDPRNKKNLNTPEGSASELSVDSCELRVASYEAEGRGRRV